MDLLGPFPMASGQRRFVIVAIDYFTKWTEAESLATINSAKCEDFFGKNVVCHFGVPRALVVDNGKQFDNNNFRTFCTNLSIDLKFTSVAHPQSNGQTEYMNRSILQGLKKKLDEAKGTWVDELPKVLWSYRTTPPSVTGETTFFLCYGTEALLPVEIGVPTIRALHFNEVNNEDGLWANLDLVEEARTQAHELSVNNLSRQRYHSRQNEVIQGDIRKALGEHLLGLREAKLINLKVVIRTLFEPFIPSIPIKEVADALITSLLHLFCHSHLCPFQPHLQSLNLCKIYEPDKLPPAIGNKLPWGHVVMLEETKSKSVKRKPISRFHLLFAKTERVEKLKAGEVEKMKEVVVMRLKVMEVVDLKSQLHYLKLKPDLISRMNYC
ncbi:hypothetical protein RJ639_045976 [Escallonia herrerae]|uniref:Integrase catalytic domain-containing protein n=1 Tax=Escallonia herrerae TaxID=1293975 RepID=A0AA88W880_9ASTE|nr:hypothetical protein RJ639_045976 [Escallonia herrerae]